jgi:hypothetical protein
MVAVVGDIPSRLERRLQDGYAVAAFNLLIVDGYLCHAINRRAVVAGPTDFL